jgi:hypothetical protein
LGTTMASWMAGSPGHASTTSHSHVLSFSRKQRPTAAGTAHASPRVQGQATWRSCIRPSRDTTTLMLTPGSRTLRDAMQSPGSAGAAIGSGGGGGGGGKTQGAPIAAIVRGSGSGASPRLHATQVARAAAPVPSLIARRERPHSCPYNTEMSCEGRDATRIPAPARTSSAPSHCCAAPHVAQ